MNIFFEYIVPIILGLALGIAFLVIKEWFSTKVNPLDEETFKTGMRKGQLVDLRKPSEFEKSHIKGARNFQLSALKKSQSKIRKDLPVYLYHQTPSKAKRASRRLNLNGYQTVYYLNLPYHESL